MRGGYAPRDVTTWDQPSVTVQFNLRRLAMMVNGPWELGWQLQDTDVNFGIAGLPVPRAGQAPVVPMGGEAFGIAATIDPAKEQAAFEFITYLMRPENMARVNLASGTIPTRAAAVPTVLEGNPQLAIFIRQAETALPRPVMGGHEKYTEVSAITRRHIQRALAGMVSPERAFQDAAREIRDLFDTDQAYRDAMARARTALAQVLGR